MEEVANIESIFGWKDLGLLAILLVGLYVLVHFIRVAVERYLKENRIGNRLQMSTRRFELFYKPLAWLILLLGFISINPIWHGSFALTTGILAFPYLRNYVSGLFLRSNALLEIGATIQNQDKKGEISKINFLGLVLDTEKGEQFIWYRQFDKEGFVILSPQINLRQQTIYFKSEMPANQLLDTLFDHPSLSFGKRVSLRSTTVEDIYLFQFSLEQGAQLEDLTAYVNERGIESSLTEQFD